MVAVNLDLSKVEELKEVVTQDGVNDNLKQGFELLDFKVVKGQIVYIMVKMKED